jgi:hypothetical protein
MIGIKVNKKGSDVKLNQTFQKTINHSVKASDGKYILNATSNQGEGKTSADAKAFLKLRL